jgi:hypothetical protein
VYIETTAKQEFRRDRHMPPHEAEAKVRVQGVGTLLR